MVIHEFEKSQAEQQEEEEEQQEQQQEQFSNFKDRGFALAVKKLVCTFWVILVCSIIFGRRYFSGLCSLDSLRGK